MGFECVSAFEGKAESGLERLCAPELCPPRELQGPGRVQRLRVRPPAYTK